MCVSSREHVIIVQYHTISEYSDHVIILCVITDILLMLLHSIVN